MSVGYYPKNEQASGQALRVQELVVSGADPQLFQISGGNCFIMVREPVEKVFVASCKVDSTNLVTQFAAASIVICDSSALTAGGDKGAIKLTGLAALNPLDVVIVRYSVLEHL
jgi:hypothetical protein